MDNRNTHRSRRSCKRLFALLCIVAVAVTAPSCGFAGANADTTDPVTETTVTTVATEATTEPPAEPGSVVDHGGASFKILVTDTERTTGFAMDKAPTVIARMDDARGKQLAFDLNLAIKVTKLKDPAAYVRSAYAAGEGDTADLLVLDLYVDTASSITSDTTGLLTAGMLARLNEIGSVHLDGDGYFADINEALSVCSSVYMAASAATAGFRDSLTGMAFDKGVIGEDVDALTALVSSGKWTLDALNTAVKDAGNGINISCDEALTLAMGMGIKDAVPTADGFKVAVMENGGVELFTKLKDTLYANVDSDGTVGNAESLFRLCSVARFAALPHDRYGLLPLPKADEKSGYISVADPDKATVMAITSFCDDPERGGLVMDLLVSRTAEQFGDEYINDVCGNDAASADSLRSMLGDRAICVIAVLGYPDTLESACVTLITGKNTDANALLKQRSYFLQSAFDTIVADILRVTGTAPETNK